MTAGGGVVLLAAADGGYFAPAWGWAALAAAWLLALGLVLRRRIEISPLEWAWLGALTAFGCWIWLSGIWSQSPTLSLLEGQRVVIYVATAAAAVVLADRHTARGMFLGVFVALVGTSSYGLVAELVPELTPRSPRLANLSEPIGYSNAMGLLSAQGAVVALVVCSSARTRAARAAAGASFAVLLPSLYLSSSRGAWLALAVGLAVASALVPEARALWISATALVPLPLLATLVTAVTPVGFDASSSNLGERIAVAVAVVVVAALTALVAAEVPSLRRRLRERPRVVATALGVLAIAAALALVSSDTITAFGARSPFGGDLANLLTFSGHDRGKYWSVAWKGFTEHRVLGSGAGTFGQLWLLHRPTRVLNVLDAHNAYLEALAELGPLGLLLLLAALAPPVVAMTRTRGLPFAAAAAGVYSAFVVHSALDWDWELPALTVSALLAGCALLVAARSNAQPTATPVRVVAFFGACGIGGLALAGLIANGALWKSSEALGLRDFAKARAEANRAGRWDLWSAKPEQLLGETELAAGHPKLAARSFRMALAHDGSNYALWRDLAAVTTGSERARALARAAALNPKGGALG